MARSIQEINDSIIAEKEATPGLEVLTSTSATALWRLWCFVTTGLVWGLEKLWDIFRAEVDEIVARAVPGTPAWYASKVLEFQLGETVEVVDHVIRYPASASGPRIITRATAKEVEAENGLITLFVKVAKDGDTPSTLQALSTSEITQVRGYIRAISPTGPRIQVVSREADRLKMEGNIYYNPLLDLAEVKAAVTAAIAAYLAKLSFDGVIYRSKIQDAIQAVPGIIDVELGDITARSGLVEYAVNRLYETQAGYVVEDEDALFANRLTFIPNV